MAQRQHQGGLPLRNPPSSISRAQYESIPNHLPLPDQRPQDAPRLPSARPSLHDGFIPNPDQQWLPNIQPAHNVPIRHSVSTDGTSKPSSVYIKDWPTAPRELGKAGKSTLIWRFIDIILSIVPVLVIALVALAGLADGKTDHPDYSKIIAVTSIAVSIYPIIFAAIVGRTLDAIACWRVERGSRIQFLEQVLGSTTVYNTVNVHLRLRAFNAAAFALFVVWSLSPIGGQGILRLLSIEERFTTATSLVGYPNTSALNPGSVFSNQKGTGVQLPAMNAVYRASIIAPNATMSAPQDTWGNIKIPRIEALEQTPRGSSEWIKVPKKDVAYSSLVGIPSIGVAPSGNSSFIMECSYYDLACEDPVQVSESEEVSWHSYPDIDPGLGSIRLPNGSSPFDSTFSLGTFTPYKNRFTGLINGSDSDTSNDDNSPRNINIQSVTGSMYSWGISTTNCTIKTSVVEVAVRCLAQNCTVSNMRRLNRTPDFLENYTPFENSEFAYFFFAHLTQATGSVQASSPFWYSTLTEDYVASGFNPLASPNRSQIIDMYKLSGEELGIRWGRLLNTYFLISSVPLAITGQYARYNLTQYNNIASNEIPFTAIQSSAEIRTSERVYRMHRVFLVLTVVSASVLLFCALLGPWLKFINIAPDLVGHISSVTRDNPYFTLPPGGSMLGGYERARLLKDVEIIAGDVSAGGAKVGQIAFTPATGPKFARRLRRGRWYM